MGLQVKVPLGDGRFGNTAGGAGALITPDALTAAGAFTTAAGLTTGVLATVGVVGRLNLKLEI